MNPLLIISQSNNSLSFNEVYLLCYGTQSLEWDAEGIPISILPNWTIQHCLIKLD